MIQPGSKVRPLMKLYDRMAPRQYSVEKGTVGTVLEVAGYRSDDHVTGILVALVLFKLDPGLAFCQVNVRALEEVV